MVITFCLLLAKFKTTVKSQAGEEGSTQVRNSVGLFVDVKYTCEIKFLPDQTFDS